MSQDKKEFPLPTSIVDQENRKTANHLPRFFRSDSNKKFLGGTLDPLNRPGKLERINAYIGRRDVPNYNFDDNYVQENSTPRQYYQLEPAFVKENQVTGEVEWYADYIDYINTLRYFGANVGNHSKLNKQEAYTWNPHINWDMIVNYREYYWLPSGPDPITIYGDMEDTISTYTVTSIDQDDNVGYIFSPDGLTVNPMLELYRGVKYRFEINTPGKFFAIKTALGANDSNYFNIGVSNQAVDKGVVEFEIPVEAPDMLYYQDIADVETFGTILIRDIRENTKLDVEKEILGKKFYKANTTTTQVDLINGLKLKFRGKIIPEKYAEGFWYVEGVGNKIKLINSADIEAPAIYGSTKDQPFDDQPFDAVPWENADNYPTVHDYIVINRASRDRNSWTKNNRWFNIRVLELTAKANALNPNRAAYDVDQTARATRPIIEFEPDIKLFNHGYYSRLDVDLVDDVTVDVFSTIEGTTGYYIDSEQVLPGYKILFTADTDILVKGKIYEVKLITAAANKGLKQLTLQEIAQTDPQEGENVYVKRGKKYKGSSFHYEGGTWKLAQKKSNVNQAPLFDLFDNNGVSYNDSVVYPFNTFSGNRIFGYKIGTGTVDKYLGFPLVYRNINNVGDITFEFDLQKGSWTYLSEGVLATLTPHGSFLRKLTDNNDFDYSNGWIRTDRDTEQSVIRILQVNTETDLIPIDVYDNSGSIADYKVRVYVNDIKRSDVALVLLEGDVYIKFTNILSVGDKVVYKVRSIENKNTKGYYEIPLNWQNNSLNDTVDSFTLGEVIDHVKTIVEGTRNFSGTYPGPGNLSDLGPLTQFGRKFMQHTGPMGLSSFLLVDKDVNIVKALRWTSRKYSEFKKEFLKIANSLGIDGPVHEIVDTILSKYSFSKSINMSAFYYSDMVPVTTDSIRSYEVTDPRSTSFIIDNIFDPTAKSQRAVLVYLNDEQLIYGKDYYFDADDAFITITAPTKINDKIIIKDYATTNGNYVPFTPSKLGLYPLYEPSIYKDNTYNTPTWVIQGHDGSITKAYGDYGDQIIELEYRDSVLLELERRIFNNCKIQYDPTIFNIDDIIGGYYRRGEFTKREINDIFLNEFLRWNSIPSFDFNSNSYYIEEESFTYNYNQSTAPNQNELLYGFWRGIYKYFYDTDRPHTHPWEMQGFTIKPKWWNDVYGEAPYTSENKILWDAIEQGIINDPANVHTNIKYSRPGISNYLPVDDAGNLLSPLQSGLALNFTLVNAKGKYAFGDQGPVETAWRKSSEYPFAVMIACSILRGSEFIGKMWDRFTIKRNIAGQIYLTTSNKKVRTADLPFANEKVNGVTTITSGLSNIIEEYVFAERNKVIDEYKDTLRNLDVKLSYRLGGFSSKEKMKVLLGSRSPNASGTVFLPPENYKIFFNKSAPVETINYSGVVIEKRRDGFLVKGYDNERNYFEILPPIEKAGDTTFTVGGISESYVDWTAGKYYSRGQIININVIQYYRAKVSHTASDTFNEDNDKWAKLPALPIVGGQSAIHRTKFSPNPIKVPYGTTFVDVQSVVDFILGYQERLKSWGFQFDDFSDDLSLPFNWLTSAKEFLFWTLHNWAAGDDTNSGAVITLSPAANNLKFKPTINASVDSLDADFYDYSIFKANGQPLKPDLKNIYREDNGFEIKPSNTTNDGIFHIRTNLVYKEHIILFDNTSIFGDVVYDVVPGYRQGRLKLLGFKTTKWDGGFTAPGFLYDEAKVQTWQPYVDYNIGDIVQYQNYYFTSTTKIYNKSEFTITDGWKQLDEAPTAQLIPNFDYKIEQFRDFYNLESSNFDENQQRLARHIIGYQPRQYFDDIIIDDVSQYKFYQGFIKEKGTLNSVTKLFDALRASGFSSIELKEEWAFKVGDFGASDAYTELEFSLDEVKVLYNPQNINLTVNPTEFEDLTIYNIPTNDVDIKPKDYDAKPFKMADLDFNQNDYGVFKYKVAGYVRDEDVDHIVYDEASLLNYDITLLKNGDNIWLGNNASGDWDVFEYTNTGIQIEDWNIVENTITLICSEVIRLKKDDIIVLKNIDILEGIYKIQKIYNNIIEIFTFNTTVYKIDEDTSSFGIVYLIESARFKTPSDLAYRKYTEFNVRGRKAWVDNDLNNHWVALENIDAFTESEIKPDLFITTQEQLFGYEVKISDNKLFMFVSAPKNTGGVISAPDAGRVLVYSRPDTITNWAFLQSITVVRDFSASNLTGNEMFGASIDCTSDGKTLVISAPNFSNLKSNYRGGFSATGPTDIDGYYNKGDVVKYNGKLYECQKYVKNSSITDIKVWKLAEEVYKASVIEAGSNLTGQGVVFVYEYDEVGKKYDRAKVSYEDSTVREQIIGSYDPKENEHFGSTVKISPDGQWLFVSSKNYWISNTSFPEDSSKGIADVGRVHIFRKGEQGWKFNIQQPVIRGDQIFSIKRNEDTTNYSTQTPNKGSQFGYDIDYQVINGTDTLFPNKSVNLNVLAISAPFLGAGAVYLLTRYSGEFTFELSQVIDSDTIVNIDTASTFATTDYFLNTGDLFGYSLAFRDNSLTISCPNDDNSGINVGSVYHFDFTGLDSSNNFYTLRQVITPPMGLENERFGTNVSISPSGKVLAVSAIGGNSIIEINFDKTFDRVIDDGSTVIVDEIIPTTFDDKGTIFYDTTPYTGAVYVFNKFGEDYIFADKLKPSDDLSMYDNFGYSISVDDNCIAVGTPNRVVNNKTLGSVFIFDYNHLSWNILASETNLVDIEKFKKAFIYDTKENVLLGNLDFIDPAKGRIPGIVDQEIRYQTYYDPAIYEFGVEDEVAVDQSAPWTDEHVGEIWWDLSKVKFTWYEQGTSTYKTNNWGRLFPGSSVDIYEWVESIYLPSRWLELADTQEGLSLGISGVPKDIDDFTYSTKFKYDPVSGSKTTLYYYWVKNKTIVPRNSFRTLAASDIANLILDPKSQGYKFIAITGDNSLSVVNIRSHLKDKDVSFNVQFYQTENTDLLVHREYALIAQDDADARIPSVIENKWFDSLIGYTIKGQRVPDTRLSVRQRYGSSNDPRQSWFINRFEALKQTFEYVNSVLEKVQIVDEVNFTNLNRNDPAPVLASTTDLICEIDEEVDILEELRFVIIAGVRPAIINLIVSEGKVANVLIEDAGFGYKTSPVITVTGTGTGAQLKAIIDTNGRVVSVEIIKAGLGYDTNNTRAVVRSFTVLVKSDNEASGGWTLQAWDNVKQRWNRVKTQSYDVRRYWSYKDWYATGYNLDSKIDYQVESTKDLNGLAILPDELVKIRNVGLNSWLLLKKKQSVLTYYSDFTDEYEVVGKQNATIEFSDKIYNLNRDLGFDTKFTFDLNLYDQSPTTELRIILESLRDDILIGNRRIEYINTFFNNVHYALHEHLYVDWVFKTSFLKVQHNVGSLKQRLNFQSDVLDSYQQFVEEAKPYKSKIREFVSSYNSIDMSSIGVTDFDLPSYYDYNTGRIERVTSNSPLINQYPWNHWVNNHSYELTDIILVDPGNFYNTRPKVIISGDGTGAKATAYIANSKVLKIVIDNPGSGYTTVPTIFISGGNGDRDEYRAKAYARIGNTNVRTNRIAISYDRITSTYEYSNFKYTDTFLGSVGKSTFKLTYAPELEKNKFNISVNGIEVFGSQFDVSVSEVLHDSYTALEGFITFKTIPSVGSTIIVEYYKNIRLYSAADRINYAYNPTSSQYGKDLGLLMTGVDYGGVQLTSIDFEISGGWDVIPWDVTSWDSVIATNDDVVTNTDGTTRNIPLGYTPAAGEIINVYLTYDVTDSNDTSVWPTGHGKGNILYDDAGKKITRTIRIDDPIYDLYDGSTEQANGQTVPDKNVIMKSFVGDGRKNHILIPTDHYDFETNTYRRFDLLNDTLDGFEDLFTFRKSTSEGTILPTDRSLIDSFVDGGNLAYTTATGVKAEEIIIDGDGLVTQDTSHGPEELIQGQVVDTLEINVYHTPSSGSPNIIVMNYVGTGVTDTFPIKQFPSTADAMFIIVDGKLTDHQVNYETSTVTLHTIPPLGAKIAFIIGDTGGYGVAEKTLFIGDGITQSFLTGARYNNGNVSGFITVNGVPATFSISESDNSYEVIGNVVIRLDVLPGQGSVIQVMLFNGLVKQWSEIRTQAIECVANQTQYTLEYAPAVEEPFSSMAFVIMENDFLQAPDYEYFDYNGTDLTISDLRYSSYSLVDRDVNVYRNGIKLTTVVDYVFDAGTNSVKLITDQVRFGDRIIIEIVKNADFKIIGNRIIIDNKNFLMSIPNSSSKWMYVTTFTNHDILKVKTSNSGFGFNTGFDLVPYDISKYDLTINLTGNGIVDLPRTVSDLSGVFVSFNRKLLSPNIDYVVLDNRRQIKVLLPEVLRSDDYIQIITFNPETVRPSYGFKIFKDMINRHHYKRLDSSTTTFLKTELKYTDTSIEVNNGSLLPVPNKNKNIPGVIIIDNERIEYLVKRGNKLSQLRRGTLGTGIKESYPIGTEVQDIGQLQTIPYIDTEEKQVLYGNGSKLVFDLEYIPIATAGTINNTSWYRAETTNINAGKFVIGNTYIIVSLGNTDFTKIGAASNIVGYMFVATGQGSGTGVARTPGIPANYGQCDQIEVFVSGRRLRKNPMIIYDSTSGQDCYYGVGKGEKYIEAEFSVDGVSKQIRFTVAPESGATIVIVRKTGRTWQKVTENGSLVFSNTDIAKFLTEKQVKLPK